MPALRPRPITLRHWVLCHARTDRETEVSGIKALLQGEMGRHQGMDFASERELREYLRGWGAHNIAQPDQAARVIFGQYLASCQRLRRREAHV